MKVARTGQACAKARLPQSIHLFSEKSSGGLCSHQSEGVSS